ncbi:MAG: hypothetical protein MJZ94_06575 [Bacteroidales bacterium]|nr:hypothetical protein [Bacteroidales bacterium]
MKYIHPEREYIRIEVHTTLNGFSVFARNMHTNTMVPLTQGIATLLEAVLPDGYCPHHSSLRAAEMDLKRLAEVNGWAEVTEQ